MFDLIVCAVLAALSGMGVGGGGLFVVYLAVFGGAEQHTAQAVNLLIFLVSASAALAVHLRKRRIDKKLVSILALSGIAGCIPGAYAASIVPTGVLGKIFGAMLVVSSAVTLSSTLKDKKKEGKDSFVKRK